MIVVITINISTHLTIILIHDDADTNDYQDNNNSSSSRFLLKKNKNTTFTDNHAIFFLTILHLPFLYVGNTINTNMFSHLPVQ